MRHRFSASLITLSLLLSLLAFPSSALTQIPTEARVGDRCEKDPKDYKLIVGLSLGYPSDNPINTFNVGRDDLDLGF